MSSIPTTASLGISSWDGEGRRVSGGPLAPDPPVRDGDDEFTFSDVLSVINPLQHLPVVSTIYRWLTGDTIKPAARVIGGALYGGPLGLVTAAFNAVVEQVKGADIGTQLLAMAGADAAQPEKAVAVAAAAPDGAGSSAAEQPKTDDAAANLAALQQFAADLRSLEPAPAARKGAEDGGAAPVAPPGQGRTLSFYQANAGRRLAPVENGGRNAMSARPVTPLVHTPASAALTPKPVADGKSDASAPGNTAEGPPAAWFASAMMRGLDRYRAAQQLDKATPQLDLSH